MVIGYLFKENIYIYVERSNTGSRTLFLICFKGMVMGYLFKEDVRKH